MSADATRQAVERFFAVIGTMDGDAIAAGFADDAVVEDPVGTPTNQGRDAIRAFFGGMTRNFASLAMAPEETFVNGGSAAVKWSGQVTGANGRSASFAGIDVFDVDAAGQIRHLRGYWDPRALMRQLRG